MSPQKSYLDTSQAQVKIFLDETSVVGKKRKWMGVVASEAMKFNDRDYAVVLPLDHLGKSSIDFVALKASTSFG